MTQDKYPFGTFGPEQLEKVIPGLECYNNREFWECHEVLEDVWIEDSNDPARNVYWAIIQVATACYHYRNGNVVGAQGMLKKAKQKFKRCEDQHIETDLLYNKLDWKEFKGLAFAVEENAPLEKFKPLHDFKFRSYK
jgi:predicted metal-dependent hydrolase